MTTYRDTVFGALLVHWLREMVRVSVPSDGTPLSDNPSVVESARLGLAEEVGEVLGLFKKNLGFGKPLPMDKLEEELGDVLYYVGLLALTTPGLRLSRVFARAIVKLQTRFPDGFSKEAALARVDGQLTPEEWAERMSAVWELVSNPGREDNHSVEVPYRPRTL